MALTGEKSPKKIGGAGQHGVASQPLAERNKTTKQESNRRQESVRKVSYIFANAYYVVVIIAACGIARR